MAKNGNVKNKREISNTKSDNPERFALINIHNPLQRIQLGKCNSKSRIVAFVNPSKVEKPANYCAMVEYCVCVCDILRL